MQIHHADCRDVVRGLPDNSIDSIVTDPPYALVSIVKRFANSPRNENTENLENPYGRTGRGFMGKKWDTGETAFAVDFWRECLRVLKPGGHVAAFGATRAYHRMAVAIEDAGFEIRDSLMWVYGTGFPKSQDVSKFIDKQLGAERTEVIGKSKRHGGGIVGAGTSYEISPEVPLLYAPATPAAAEWEGFGTALKPAFEPIVLARKPLSEGTVAANLLRWRTGALNIDGCRIEGESTKRNNHGGTGDPTQWRTGNGGDFTSGSDAGRWPANVCHDGSDEVIAAFPDSNGQQGRAKLGGAKGGSIYGKFAENATTNPEPRGDSGSAARFFYSAKASKADRNGSKHPTVKPIALMQWLARLVTPPGGTVLDPFAGSGTTGAACRLEGFNFILCEREDEYVADIRRRLGAEQPPVVMPWETASELPWS